MIERISRTPPSAPDQPMRRDPRTKDVIGNDEMPIKASARASELPRIDVHGEAKFRLRREMREPITGSVTRAAQEAKAERSDPRAKRNSRIRPEGRSDASKVPAARVETATPVRETVVCVENPAAYILVVSIGEEAWSGSEREMLGGARQIADGIVGAAVTLLRIGVEQPDCKAGPAGADRVLEAGDGNASPEAASACVLAEISRFAPRHVIFADGSTSGDIARRVAAELGERPAVSVQKLTGDSVVSRGNGGRSDFARAAPRILIATPGLFDPLENAGPREARTLEPAVPALTDTRVRHLGPDEMSVADVPLSEADFIVSAGDGITDWPAFFDVADALSGVVGGSRQVCDAGLLPRHRQVGASGTLVEAKAYLALGISGAPQHLQGIQRCRFVAAVNTDLHAAMVKRADIAIIADAQQVMPELASLAREKRRVR